MKSVLLSCFLLLFANFLNAQQVYTQNIRGVVADKFTNKPIEGTVITVIGEQTYQDTTTADGSFSIKVNIGRYTLFAQKENYQGYVQRDIIVNSAKEIYIPIELDEKMSKKIDEVGIKVARAKHKTINEMSLISARQFSVDEANRYAGSLGDPARMAQNFAGVQSNGDRRNDIIIRGNSPLGLSWRLEGIEIPNPNHFSGIGLTGGAISILNNNNLSNSDFLTGAFIPQYGNALAGVFDLRLRNGNAEQHEYVAQFGLNGLEFGAEGPISKSRKSSYIVNARYSTLEIFDALNINLGATAKAQYRDITFKLNFPSAKYGNLSVWGIGGFNLTTSLSKDYDTTGKKINPRPKGFDTEFDNWMYAVGVNHQYNFSKKLNSKLCISLSSSSNSTHVDSLYNNDNDKWNWLSRFYNDTRLSATYQLSKKWNSHHQTQAGVYFSKIFVRISDSIWLGSFNRYVSLLKYNDNADLNRVFIQHLWKPIESVQVTAGLHGMHFGLNNSKAIEPRASIRWQVNPKGSVSFGYGTHNQLQPFTTYFYNRTGVGNFVDSLTNKNLDFISSQHFVLGTEYIPYKNYRLKLEAYYQRIAGAAVESKSSSYSTLNEGAYYFMVPRPFNINAGEGYNRGIELTIEKFFSKQFYFLFSSSIYESKYKASDLIWRNTAFNGRHSMNALAGYEFKINKTNALTINGKFTWLGGRMYTPIDTALSVANNQTEFVDAEAFTLRYPDYIRPDIKISYRLNAKKVSHEFGINVDNFVNYQNIQSIEYDSYTKRVGYSYQNGRFPVIQYRIEF